MTKQLNWCRMAGTFVAATLCCVSSPPLSAQPWAHVQDVPGGPVYRGGELLVQFKPTATDGQIADAARRAGLGLIEQIQTAAMRSAGHPGISYLSTPLPVPQAIRALQNHPAIEFAEPNWVYQHFATSDDFYYLNGSLWGMYGDVTSPANQFGSQAGEAWAAGFSGSETVVVGVIDEGIMIQHDDLAANIWTNPGEIAGNGIDDDKNGYVDDVNGWDFVNNDNSVYDGSGDDHATHVAGTIGGVGGNGKGVAGVCWEVKMISAKFLGSGGGSTANAISAVDYLTDLKTRHGLKLIASNNSWGGGGFSQALYQAIDRANAAGILFVAAAGNSGYNIDVTPSYPAAYNNQNIISVAAIASNGGLASWSNYGKTTVDLGAPGVSIVSTIPARNGTPSYGSYSGTSMAAPHVTGAVALYAAANSSATAAQIKGAVLGKATPTASLSGKTVTGGRLNVSDMLGPVNNVDNPPTVSITSPANGATFAPKASITFTGTATDPEDGNLTSSLAWSSSKDGSIGTGGSVSKVLSDGTHTITASVTDSNGKVGSASVTITVGSATAQPLIVQVETDKDSYVNRETVRITSTVTDEANLPVSGAAVNLVLVTANGNQLAGNATTDSSGQAVFTYKINTSRDGKGTYKATVTANNSGYTSGSGEKTFTVN